VTNRVINLTGAIGGATLTQSGTGLLRFSSAFTSTIAGSKTLTLSGSTAGTGEIGGAIVNNSATGTTALAVAYTLATPTSTIRLGSVNGITIGATISGTGIQGGTTITAIDSSTNTVTLSLPTNAAGAVGQTMTVTGVTNLTSLAKSGTGTWTLSANNTFTGTTTINGGTLKLSGAGRLGGGNYSRAMSIAPGATFECAIAPQTLSGAITGGGNVVVSGASSGLILSGAGSSYGSLTMTCDVIGGRVFIGNTGALPAAATVAINGGTLVINAAGTYNSPITAASGVGIAGQQEKVNAEPRHY
jgi:autotransporter-associated beta strand protein